MGELWPILWDNAAAVAGRVIVGTLVAGVLALVVVALSIKRRAWLSVGAPYDPWPARAGVALWIVIALPAFVVAGALAGLGFGAASVVERNHVTERAMHGAMHAVIHQLTQDEVARGYVDGASIAIDDIAKLVERAPAALGNVTHETTQSAVRAVGGDSYPVELSGKLAAWIARWLAKSQAEDRLKLVTPVVAAAKAKDTDGDGKVALADVVDAAVRIHLEPRAARVARDLIVGQAAAPLGIGAGAVVLPMLGCTLVRRRRARTVA